MLEAREIMLVWVQDIGFDLALGWDHCGTWEEWKNDPEIMLAAVRENRCSYNSILCASKELKDNCEFMLAVVRQELIWTALEYASERLKNNGEFILKAVEISPFALNYAYRFLTFDKDEEDDIDFSLDAKESDYDREFMLQAVQSKWVYRPPSARGSNLPNNKREHHTSRYAQDPKMGMKESDADKNANWRSEKVKAVPQRANHSFQ